MSQITIDERAGFTFAQVRIGRSLVDYSDQGLRFMER